MHYHFIGICGTAMASVAIMAKAIGHRVTGSDENVYPPMSLQLAEQGIEVKCGYAAGNLDPRPDWVVVGNALSRGNDEIEAVLNRRIPYLSMPELLGREFIRDRTSVVITGTHGKTTTASLMAWMLDQAGLSPGFMIGGIPLNFGLSGRNGEGGFFVTEGDEYDTAFFDKRSKFFHYRPESLVLNNIEFDHADIFPNLDAILLSFERLVNIVPGNGLIAANADDPNVARALQKAHTGVQTYGLGSGAEWTGIPLEMDADGQRFAVRHNQEAWGEFRIPMWGAHAVSNALACIVVASHHGMGKEAVAKALSGFRGVKRRMELRGEVNGIRVYDDFAHHPTAIAATLSSVKRAIPDGRLWGVFEPRSNTSRTNLMQRELSEALACADIAVLAGVHRLERVPESRRLDAVAVIRAIQSKDKQADYIETVDEIVDHVSRNARPGDVIVGMSNGGFDGFHERMLKRLREG